jgi:flagellar biosynthesis/type III secretory pathway chaperone
MPESKGLALLEEKLRHLSDIKELTERERTLVSSEDGDDIFKVEAVLEQKSVLMSKIDEIDEEYRALVPRKTEEIKAKEADIKFLLQEILYIDRDKTNLMEQKFKELKGNLKGVRQNIRANRAYGYEEAGTMFINEKK